MYRNISKFEVIAASGESAALNNQPEVPYVVPGGGNKIFFLSVIPSVADDIYRARNTSLN